MANDVMNAAEAIAALQAAKAQLEQDILSAVARYSEATDHAVSVRDVNITYAHIQRLDEKVARYVPASVRVSMQME